MKSTLFFISFILFSISGNSQSFDREAMQYYTNAMYKVMTKNLTGAIHDFTEAIKLDTNFLQAYENRGVARFYLEDYEGAITDYNKALEINPYDYNTFGRRGWAKFTVRDFKGAIDDFTCALEGSQNEAKNYLMRGESYFRLQGYKKAISDFDKVIRLGTGDRKERSEAFFWRGLAKIEIGQKENGCSDLSKADRLGYSKAYDLLDIYCK